MNIKKLTLAAIMAVGMVAGGQVTLAQEPVAENMSDNVIAACPLSGCQTPKAEMPDCDCMPEIDDCSKQPHHDCDAPKDDCTAKSDCEPCEQLSKGCDDCPEPPKCETPANPVCALCPQPSDDKKFQQQVYAYPNAIYGKNHVVGERNNAIFLGDGSYNQNTKMALNSGVPVADNCGCADGNMTGAAAPLGCDNDTPMINGIPVDNSPSNLDGADCPIQIHTNTSTEVLKKTYKSVPYSGFTGGAAPFNGLSGIYNDVPNGYWAGCDINKLTENNILAGYPDRTFKPALPVSRAEMATMIVKGFNLDDELTCPQAHFKDVSPKHWANKTINKAVANGLMSGYPDNKFRPEQPVSRAEALTIISKGVKCPMDDCKAKDVLSKYCDGDDVPSWAQIPIAKSLDNGAIKDTPHPDVISPNKDASRADVASMLENVRVSLGYDKDDIEQLSSCDCQNKTAYIEEEKIATVPTLQLCFKDEISSRASNIGDQFAATTLDAVTINGIDFPAGSRVDGKVLEVVRPTKNCQGALKLSFDTIKNGDCKAKLPTQILAAQVNQMNKPNGAIRLIEFPFTWTGGLLGDIGRTVGGALVNIGNASEEVVSGFGVGTGELFRGQFRAAGRSYQDMTKAIGKAPVDMTRTALSGTLGLFQYSADEITYLVDPKGMKISSINPKEKITISFGCQRQ